MHAPLNPFLKQMTAARKAEAWFFWALRLATYLVLAAATSLFAVIFYKGGGYVIQPKNWPFLTEKPESLHIAEIDEQSVKVTAAALENFRRFTKNLAFTETGREREQIREFQLAAHSALSLENKEVDLSAAIYEKLKSDPASTTQIEQTEGPVVSFEWNGKAYRILESEYSTFIKKHLSLDTTAARDAFEKEISNKHKETAQFYTVTFPGNSPELNSVVTLSQEAHDLFVANPFQVLKTQGGRDEIYVTGVLGKQELKMGDRAYRILKGLNPGFAPTHYKSQVYAAGGVLPNILGTILLTAGSIIIALTLGVLSAIFLSEYGKKGLMLELIRLAILNLSGVPSIVFGMFGYGMFVILFGWNTSLMAGWFTLAFMVLPVIITASEESLRAVPQGFREGTLALGATKWQTVRLSVLPYALPGILTSSVLGIARVAGETAPIMFTAAYVIRDEMPWQVSSFSDFFFQGVMALPYHIFVVSARVPQNEYTEEIQYATAFVFLFLVMLIALTSIILRSRVRGQLKW
jgi:phosphate transport system permease protein